MNKLNDGYGIGKGKHLKNKARRKSFGFTVYRAAKISKNTEQSYLNRYSGVISYE
jgi:hypothetical protein